MCIICGDNKHVGFELLQKARTIQKEKGEKPRFKAQANLEFNFKKQFAENLADTVKEIMDSLK